MSKKTAIYPDSVALDSAIFILEAALNYDFDYPLEGSYPSSRTDTLSYTIPLDGNNMKISSDDLENAYGAFSDALSDSSDSDFKIKCLDLIALVPYPDGSSTELVISTTKYAYNYYPANCPTNPFSSSNTYKPMSNSDWNVYFASTCGANSLPEATAALNIYKNCMGISHSCPGIPSATGFFYNVWTTNPYDIWIGSTGCVNNPMPNELWCAGNTSLLNSSSWWCTSSNTALSGTQLNTYLSNQFHGLIAHNHHLLNQL